MHTHITRAHLKGYRNIQDTEATFREGLNIIIGPNGCGKTNFLWLLANIGKKDTEIMTLDMKADIEIVEHDGPQCYKLFINIAHEYINDRQRMQNGLVKKVIEKVELGETENNTLSPVLSSNILLSFNNPNEIPFFSTSAILKIKKERGVLFAETNNYIIKQFIWQKVLQDFHENKTVTYTLDYFNFSNEIIEKVAAYTPVNDIRIKYPMSADRDFEDNEREIKIRSLLYEFKIGNEWFEWNELSDGTRRILWIVLSVLTAGTLFIYIEEPELGIHPHQLFLLMQFIKEQSETKQIIITTHSPEVLNVIESDELDRIKIARYDEERKTTVIEQISPEIQADAQNYMQETAFLSDYWLHLDLENTKVWK